MFGVWLRRSGGRAIDLGRVAMAGAALLSLTGCFSQTYANDYRLTVTIAVDGVERTGSGVWRIGVTDQKIFSGLAGGDYSPCISGEAIPVSLGDLGYAFVTLGTFGAGAHDPIYAPEEYFKVKGVGDEADQVRYYAAHKLSALVNPKQLPLILRFTNMQNPASAQRVRTGQQNNIDGHRVEVKSASFSVTPDRMSKTIALLLPWLSAYVRENRALNGRIGLRGGSDIADYLGAESLLYNSGPCHPLLPTQ